MKYKNLSAPQPINGHRKTHTTTSLTIGSGDDEMIDITPRDNNYTSHTMTDDEHSYNRQTSRDMSEVDGN